MAQATITTPRLELRPLTAAHAEILVELNADPAVTRYVHSGRPLTREEALADHAERLAKAEEVPGLGYWMGYDREGGEAVGWWALTPGPSGPSVSTLGDEDGGMMKGEGEMGEGTAVEAVGSTSASASASASASVSASVSAVAAEGAARGGGGLRAELGYRLLPRYWRQGLAKEGGRALVRHGFTDLAVEEVYGETMAVNAASRATMAACGLGYRRTFHLRFDGDEAIPGTEEGEVEYAAGREEWLAWDEVTRKGKA